MRVITLLIVLFTVSCTAIVHTTWNPRSSGIVWPIKDEPVRVEYLETVTPGLGYPRKSDSGFWTKIAGKENIKPLLTPYSVTVQGSGVFWAASPVAGMLAKIDLNRDSLEYFETLRGHTFTSPAVVFWNELNRHLIVSDVDTRQVLVFSEDGSLIGELTPPDGFGRPAGIAVDSSGSIYVVDVALNNVAKFTSSLNFDAFIVDEGRLHGPTNIAVGPSGRVYVADSMNFRVVVLDGIGGFVGEIGGLGDSPGYFARPRGIAIDSQENVYVSDAAFDNIQMFNSEGEFILHFGMIGSGVREFSQPAGLAIDSDDRLYVADSLNGRVKLFQLYPGGK